MSTSMISRFQDNFRKTPEEHKIQRLKFIRKTKGILVELFQQKHQSMVIERDPFTNQLRPTNEQLQHARANAHTMIPEIDAKIEALKKEHKIRNLWWRLIDGIKWACNKSSE